MMEDDVETKDVERLLAQMEDGTQAYFTIDAVNAIRTLSAQLETERRRSKAIRRALEVIRDYHECRNTLAGAVDLARATLEDTE